MEFSFIEQYFFVILIAVTIPIYWLISVLLRKLGVQSPRTRAFLSFVITITIVIVFGLLVALKGFIMFHRIPGS